MNLSKLQSEAVNKFNKLVYGQIFIFPNNIKKTTGNDGYGHTIVGTAINNDEIKQFLSDQIQKAVEETISECRRTVLETLPIYVVGKSSPFEMRNEERDSLLKKLEKLSIQTKGKIK